VVRRFSHAPNLPEGRPTALIRDMHGATGMRKEDEPKVRRLQVRETTQ
jgi:hypothetical protein